MTRVSLAPTAHSLTPASNTAPLRGSAGVTHSVRLPVSLGVTGCHSTRARRERGRRRPAPRPEQARRGEQTAVFLAPEGLEVCVVTPELRAELVRLLADALVADFIGATDADGQFPLGTQP
jgi:hypothetical protein